ncbi:MULTISPECIES: WYL domain-containing protein [unclassified Flavobacterium]|jgi:predicted DNA-binding transcriptional regulator YafY|uniref:WYL domain-containing protein n=1 Tax=unclassified Flavobacterium TaxID=196869 RepID=UPI0025C4D7FB|nr:MULTISPECIES: WYL domain-containing protein [unclassified Flavobacterium]
MLKQTERLKIIYDFLKQTSADANTILEYLKQKDAEISLRQLQRDLKEVEKVFFQPNEQLIITVAGCRKKIWKINLKTAKNELTQKTINTLYLAILTQPNLLKENRKDNIDLFKDLLQNALQQSKNEIINGDNQQLINTHFYEITKDSIFNANIDDLIGAIIHKKYIQILELINDYTVDNHAFKTEKIDFAPVSILYHRGAFLVTGVENHKQEIVIYEIGQLKKIKTLDKGYNFEQLSKKIKTELDKRFGITKNINDEVYDIKIEFTSVTGALVSKYFWHHSQHFEKKKGNHIMTMKCGINRELLGWLFQWMYNIRIIEPLILQEYYDKTLDEIIANRKTKKPLVYRNIFEPK